jgi:20S proteasome alpha/beta subunit
MNQQATLRLAVETLMEVVESEKNIELCIVKPGNVSEMVSEARINAVVAQINAEKEAKEEEKRNR